MSDLPTELICKIFCYLPKEELFWGIGSSCLRYLSISLSITNSCIDLPSEQYMSKDIMAYLEENVFSWQEVSDAIMCLLIASPDQNVEEICKSLPCNSKSLGITLYLFSHYDLLDVSISLVVERFSNLKSITLHTDDIGDLDQFFHGI